MHDRNWISLDHVDRMIALDHLDRMTDSTGLVQHAIYSIPPARAATRLMTTLAPCGSALVCGASTPTSLCWAALVCT